MRSSDVQFIDYEYSGYNYLAYDIGNHFNEFAGVSEVDYSLYPSRKLQEQWLRAYLEAYKEYKGFGTNVTEKEVEVLYVQVNQFALPTAPAAQAASSSRVAEAVEFSEALLGPVHLVHVGLALLCGRLIFLGAGCCPFMSLWSIPFTSSLRERHAGHWLFGQD
ncbi:UNVERIFIED_CONTAM: hypothetical protein K2H54_075473 [Gekko kuhli]